MRSNSLRPHQTAILAAGAASVTLWAIPVAHWVMLPMQYLNTHLHELCHALAAVATGGEPQQIRVHATGAGETPVVGGFLPIVASAGYVGAALLGAGIMLASRTEKGARATLIALGIALTLSLLIWELKSLEAFGIGSAIVWIAILFALVRFLKGPKLVFVAQFIGLQQCLNAVQSLYVLLRLSAFTDVQSDAKIMEGTTRVPALVWSVGWCLFSFAALGLAARKAWRDPSPQA